MHHDINLIFGSCLWKLTQSGLSVHSRIQLFCDPDAGVGKPLDYYVLEEVDMNPKP